MSRGLGQQQTRILNRVRALHEEGEQVSAENLRWSLYLENTSLENDSSDLPKPWCNQFRLALEKLEKGNFIKNHHRVFENFEECVQHYPGKTTDGEMRQLRIRMLPHLNEWLQADIRRANPKYGPAQNEVFRFRGMNETERETSIEAWQCLAPQLDSVYRTCGKDADQLFLLLCKGREYFLNKDVQSYYSLTILVENVIKSNVLPDSLSTDLRDFLEKFMPAADARALSFRSIIHFFTNVPSLGSGCELREDTLWHLHQKDRAFVEAMEGTQFDRTPWNGRIIGYRRNFAPRLRKLFDHSVFREFNFLEPT